MKYLYHIAKQSDWEQAQKNGSYPTGFLLEKLQEEGFIHLSYAHQVNTIAEMFYKEIPNLVLLKINPDKLTASLKDEAGDQLNDIFPHLYGALNIDAVESADAYGISSDGHFPQIAA